jgi:hypothetical protein
MIDLVLVKLLGLHISILLLLILFVVLISFYLFLHHCLNLCLLLFDLTTTDVINLVLSCRVCYQTHFFHLLQTQISLLSTTISSTHLKYFLISFSIKISLLSDLIQMVSLLIKQINYCLFVFLSLDYQIYKD